MGKKKKKKVPQKQIVGYLEKIVSEPQVHPEATLSPGASIERATTIEVLQRDSTAAPSIGEEEEEREPYVESYPALIEKYVLSRKFISFPVILFVWCIAASFIFIQDNRAGLLVNKEAIFWALTKCTVLFVFFLLIWGIPSLIGWYKTKKR